MADEDEVDVEGDFDMDIGVDQEVVPNLYIDINEPPSKSANLLPEDTQHPWMLEQGWSLDHCTDEKSKAAIEKMLQEEQQYMNGRVMVTKVAPVARIMPAAHASTSLQKQAQQRRTWTEEERRVFQQALEIYGRKWARIAELIPDKTTQQVKSYGQHYFKIKAREEEEKYKIKKDPRNMKTHLPIGIQNAIQAVTTAQPTVKVSPKKLSTYYENASLVWAQSTQAIIPTPALSSLSQKIKEMIKPKVNANRASAVKGKRGPGRPPKEKAPVKKKSKVSESPTKVKVEETVSSLVASSEVVRIPSSRDDDSEDSDVDIDIEDIDDSESQTEDIVYRQLVESAGIAPRVNGDVSEHANGPLSNESLSDVESEEEEEEEHEKLDSESLSVSKENSLTVTKPNQREKTPAAAEGPSDSTRIMDSMICTKDDMSHSPLDNIIPQTPPELLLSEPSVYAMRPKDEDNSHNVIDTDCHDSGSPLGNETTSGTFTNANSVCSTDSTSHTSQDDAGEQDTDSSSEEDDDEEDAHPNEFGILTSLGDVVYLPNPLEEVTLPRDMTSEQEQQIHSEFFTQRPGLKTPDRYLRIRNFILDAWERCRPQYLNKTSVRPGLKDCGDVNCIGRIHTYLEQVGAINYNCSQAQYLRPYRTMPVKPRKTKTKKNADSQIPRTDIPSRKRRVRDFEGQWIDERELEGKTTEHKEREAAEKKKKVVRLRTTYDPFKLNRCSKFTDDQLAPFRLEMESYASVTMDTHAHMSKTEVIGLLGGRFSPGCGEGSVEGDQLRITMAVPCESLSTGMQCEMDPVSQTEACELIERAGHSVVGWYHSHPTFCPDPSCRDIETQQKYQDWFGKGGNPFVGVIVSPYCQGQTDPRSITRCLVVMNTSDAPGAIGQPYEFDYTVTHDCWNTEGFRQQVTSLADKYVTYPNRVRLLQHYTSRSELTCLEKMVESLSHSFPESPPEGRDHLRNLVSDIITTRYHRDNDIKVYLDLAEDGAVIMEGDMKTEAENPSEPGTEGEMHAGAQFTYNTVFFEETADSVLMGDFISEMEIKTEADIKTEGETDEGQSGSQLSDGGLFEDQTPCDDLDGVGQFISEAEIKTDTEIETESF